MKATYNNPTPRNPAWLLAAPFLGLAYVIAAPFIGLGALAWFTTRAFAARFANAARLARDVALFFAAPLVGLVYALTFPFVGIAMLAWGLVEAANRPVATN